ncbi:ABC transporter permease [Clostridium oryzae]|uniref:Transport permease protein n=1 Tax=Clostridium oryzae TaxID=1450648 RepID=A0A1V4ISU4_9CLOT|nr:ABC transporter permease [Clostridium oryzae]OPJ63098.1 ABC-2 type transporter [Clostridium oryzae]
MNLKALHGTFIRNFIIQLRAYPKDFFIGNMLTGVYTSLAAVFMYHLLFKGNMSSSFKGYAGTGDYISYVIVGTAVYLYVVRTCLNVSRSLITELREGTLESIMVAPFNRIQYFVGNMLQQTITTTIEIIITIIIGMFFGLRFSHFNGISFIVAAVISLFSFFSISMLLACVMLYFRDTYISQNTLFTLIFLLCGVTFPLQYLPSVLQIISKLIPVTDAITLIRGSALSGLGLSAQMPRILYVLFISIVYCFLGFKLMKRIEYIALEKIQA